MSNVILITLSFFVFFYRNSKENELIIIEKSLAQRSLEKQKEFLSLSRMLSLEGLQFIH